MTTHTHMYSAHDQIMFSLQPFVNSVQMQAYIQYSLYTVQPIYSIAQLISSVQTNPTYLRRLAKANL